MPEGSRRPKGEDARHGLQTGAKGLPHSAGEKNAAAEPCLLTAPAEALLALSNVGWPSALDERQHRPDVRVVEGTLVRRHVRFITRHDPGRAVLDHLK